MGTVRSQRTGGSSRFPKPLQQEAPHVGHRMHRGKHGFLHRSPSPTAQAASGWQEGELVMIELFLIGIVIASLLVYLVYALLRPEKF